jgi:hypothetical protein
MAHRLLLKKANLKRGLRFTILNEKERRWWKSFMGELRALRA